MTATTQALISRRSAIRWLAWYLAAGGSAKQVFAQTRLSNTTSASDGDVLLGLNWLNRITWGATVSSLKQLTEQGMAAYLKNQLKGGSYSLPAQAQAQIDAMSISQQPMTRLVIDNVTQRKALDTMALGEERVAAQQKLQDQLNQAGGEVTRRFLLRALYSPLQLQEQMVWFWMNHFNINMYADNVRWMMADFEDHAIRPHALGHFKNLLKATVFHPAMLRYLNNEQNALGHINENYARELMELHTLGVNGGYSQTDVQELARILTGFGVNLSPLDAPAPRVTPDLKAAYVRRDLFEFNPNRHDFGDKVLLGKTIRGTGMAELDEALDLLVRSPATARFIAHKLAVFFVGEKPSAALIENTAKRFSKTDGDLAATLQSLFESQEFTASLGKKFCDPLHYVLAALRASNDERVILNPGPIMGWLQRLGEPLFSHLTPDGYPLEPSNWLNVGQMATRFDIAKSIAPNNPNLWRTDMQKPPEPAPPSQFFKTLYEDSSVASLSPSTRTALEQAKGAVEWNFFLLASPDFMYR